MKKQKRQQVEEDSIDSFTRVVWQGKAVLVDQLSIAVLTHTEVQDKSLQHKQNQQQEEKRMGKEAY